MQQQPLMGGVRYNVHEVHTTESSQLTQLVETLEREKNKLSCKSIEILVRQYILTLRTKLLRYCCRLIWSNQSSTDFSAWGISAVIDVWS